MISKKFKNLVSFDFSEVRRVSHKFVVGLMSGTSLDGIDAALVKIEEKPCLKIKLVEFVTLEYSREIYKEILICCNEQLGTVDKVCRLNFKLGELLADAALQVVKKAGISLEEVDLIGSHGQTIYHDIGKKDFISTLQVGAGGVIAEKTRITTVSNFRVRDIAAGGEGAPLVPYIDYLLYNSLEHNRILQNIGGIANYTYLPTKADFSQIKGTDTGPGNMLLDGVVSILSNGRLNYDQDGKWAKEGKVSEKFLEEMIKHPFIQQKAPKTTGREVFGLSYARGIISQGQKLGLSAADIVATTTAFTAYSIVDSYRRFIKGKIDQIIIGGGGSFNLTLLKMIKNYCNKLLINRHINILTQEELGFSSEAKEAIAFAVLAYQTMKGRANNVPQVTKAKEQVILGDITPGRNFYNYLKW